MELDSFIRKAKKAVKKCASVLGSPAPTHSIVTQSEPKQPITPQTSAEYWTGHNVTRHQKFDSRESSLNYLNWRNSQFFDYLKLMPVSGFDDMTIMDYGCGPGHDLVGFVEHSKPKTVFAVDVSSTSLAEAKERLSLHPGGEKVEFIQITEGGKIPLPDQSVDYIHSSGVLHHIEDLRPVFSEFQRILKPKGFARFMIYNYWSVYVHLYVAWSVQLKDKRYSELSLEEAFKRSTDGELCPVSRYYKPEEFLQLVRENGFPNSTYLGASVDIWELGLLNQRTQALYEKQLNQIHRDFLVNLTFDQRGLPMHDGQYAGIDAVFECRKE